VTSPASTRPDRYGSRRRLSRRAGFGLGALALALAVAWAAWVAWSDSGDRLDWTDVSFTVVDPGTTLVVFEVNRSPGRTVVCSVRALNAGYAEVGQVDVTLPPSSARSSRAEATVPTSERAVTGTVKDCVVQR